MADQRGIDVLHHAPGGGAPHWAEAVCGRCAFAFRQPVPAIGISVYNPGNEDDSGVVEATAAAGRWTTPCPRCGAQATIVSDRKVALDGRPYSIIATNYDGLLDLMLRLQREGLAAEQVAQELERTPGLAPLSKWLRENEHLGTWLSVVLAVLALILSQQNQGVSPEQLQQVIDSVVDQQRNDPPPSQGAQPKASKPRLHQGDAASQSPRRAARAPARNAPCWCLSGQKYKHCHGRAAPAPQYREQTLGQESGS